MIVGKMLGMLLNMTYILIDYDFTYTSQLSLYINKKYGKQ